MEKNNKTEQTTEYSYSKKRGGISRYLYHYIALLLSVIMLLSCALSGMYAKYVTKGSPASDEARVASYTTTNTEFRLYDDGGGMDETFTQSIPISVNKNVYTILVANCSGTSASGNVSEVAIGYKIKVETLQNLPLKYTIKYVRTSGPSADGDAYVTNSQGAVLNSETASEIILDGGVMPAGVRRNHVYSIHIEWGENKSSDFADTPEMIKVTVEATQID